MEHLGLFENLAATDDSHIVAQRQASAVAAKRVQDRFGAFLANSTDEDRRARIALVEEDITELVNEVVAEYGGDAQKIEAAIKRSMMPPGPGMGMTGMPGMGGSPAGMGGGMGQQGQTCPECGGPMVNGQCPTCGGAGAAGGAGAGAMGAGVGGYAMNHSMPQSPSTGPIQAATAKGGFCDDCRKWKSGPNAGCTCGSSNDGDNDNDSDDTSDAASAADVNKDVTKEARQPGLSIDTEPIMHAEPLPVEPGKEGVSDIDGELAKAPSAVGRGASTKESEALTTVDLPTGDESALGGPSPKIDKGNSGDQFGWSLDPIDTEMDGSPNPGIEGDPTDKADYNKEDFLDQTRAVTTTETLPTGTGMDDAGYQADRNIKQYPTKTWSGEGGQQKPVTRVPLSAVDVDKNPIQELMDEYSGFLMPNQVEAALRNWDASTP